MDIYYELTPLDKANFKSLFRTICEQLDETDGYLAMYLAATKNDAFVEGVVGMVSRL